MEKDIWNQKNRQRSFSRLSRQLERLGKLGGVASVAMTALTAAGGAKYVGEYKDGQMHGKGTFTFVDGSSYVGEHKDGNWHGKGTFTWANGTVESGIYADGEYLYESVESARSDCAKEAGKAGTEYAAKQIEKTCLAEKQLEPES